MQGSSFAYVRSAMTIFQCHDLDIADFEIMVVREKTSLVVVFINKEEKADARKSIGVREGAGVEMNFRDLNALLTTRDHFEVMDTLQGASFQPIQVAVTVFQQRNLDLQHYNITLMRDGNSLVVIFIDKDGQPDFLGNPGPRLGLEVELDSQGQHVLKSHFIR